jgi:hypothetical protein
MQVETLHIAYSLFWQEGAEGLGNTLSKKLVVPDKKEAKAVPSPGWWLP